MFHLHQRSEFNAPVDLALMEIETERRELFQVAQLRIDNSRMKDFYDVALLARDFDFDFDGERIAVRSERPSTDAVPCSRS